MTTALRWLAGALFVAQAASVHAVVTDWVLQNVTFVDGGTASGTFKFETTTKTYLDWNITTTAGTSVGTPFTTGFVYTPGTSVSAGNGSGTSFIFQVLSGTPIPTLTRQFSAIYSSDISLNTGTIPLALFNPGQEISIVASTGFTRSIGPLGAVSPVPEPSIYAMLVAGLAMVGFALRRHNGQIA